MQHYPSISVYEYIASHPESKGQANQLVQKYGLERARDNQDLTRKLAYVCMAHRERALKELAEIHPDKMLVQYANPWAWVNQPTRYQADGGVPTAINGEEIKKKDGCSCKKQEDTQNLLIAGLIVLGLIALVK